MKWPRRHENPYCDRTLVAPVTLFASSIGLAGCRPAVPDVSGKWHATAKLPNNHNRTTNADVTLMLSQADATVHGDATLRMDNSHTDRHVPIPVATIDPMGKIQLEGSAHQASERFPSTFDGVVKGETMMSGNSTITAQMMIFGKESDAGAIEFRREK
jgi:hypothetical protein